MFGSRKSSRWPVFLAIACLALAPNSLRAADAFVLICGGNSPMDNNYSHYLQSRAMADFFMRHYPSNSVWVFFGIGNVEGEKPVLSDVYHQVKHEGTIADTWLPGTLPRNHPARRDDILRSLREEILPRVASGGTLYLFVGDHGSLTPGRNPESIVTLWSTRPDPQSDHGWNSDESESLSVSSLRRALVTGLGKGRVVFCMTQCHSGGFHYLGVPHEMQPDPAWFSRIPDWARRRDATPELAVAGFTATDEYSLASGCDPSPDPEAWAGYERYLPENLLGENLFTLQPTKAGMRSFCDAHSAAVLVDPTIDKPCSTSEQYLERWANLIETRLVKEPTLTARVKRAVATFQKTVDGAPPRASDPAFKQRQVQFAGFITRLGQQNSEVRNLLMTGTRRELEAAEKEAPERGTFAPQGMRGRRGRRGAGGAGAMTQTERRRLWNTTLRPAWQKAVEAGTASTLPAAAMDFEKYLLSEEADGQNYFFGNTGYLRDEVFWKAGYGEPATMDPVKAEAASYWAAQRRPKILEWARTSADPDVQDAATQLAQTVLLRNPTSADATASERTLSRSTAAERTLFYRRVLAAWEFLLAVNEKPALARLKELSELERTPLPSVK